MAGKRSVQTISDRLSPHFSVADLDPARRDGGDFGIVRHEMIVRPSPLSFRKSSRILASVGIEVARRLVRKDDFGL